jgi:S-formylglutathione hydrolase FrmB
MENTFNLYTDKFSDLIPRGSTNSFYKNVFEKYISKHVKKNFIDYFYENNFDKLSENYIK